MNHITQGNCASRVLGVANAKSPLTHQSSHGVQTNFSHGMELDFQPFNVQSSSFSVSLLKGFTSVVDLSSDCTLPLTEL